MNRLLRSRQWLGCANSKVLTSVLYSTGTQTLTSTSNASDSLRLRVSLFGNPMVSIIPVINKWLEEGKQVKPPELRALVKLLRQNGRFRQALEVSEWMSNEIKQTVPPGDIAIRLELISKVHGLELAEEYFNSIPEKSFHLYGALLNCYADNKCLEKAEATMQSMRELGYLKGTFGYNVMLKLYARVGRHEQLEILLQEMEEKGITISSDSFTINTRLRAYASSSDIDGMEKFITRMEPDPRCTVNWNAYVIAANGYLKAGLTEKCLQMVKKAEPIIDNKTRKTAYAFFLTIYAACGSKDEVCRVWNLYKKVGKLNNAGYICMISSLVKLEDFDGAEQIFEEWESKATLYDRRIPNILISAYCKRGLLEKAEAKINKHIANGKEPDAFMWHSLATGYKVIDQMPKAVEAMKKAIVASSPQIKLVPSVLTLTACLEYLEGQGDMTAVEELLKLLSDHGYENVVKRITNRDPVTTATPNHQMDEIDSKLYLIDGDDIADNQIEADNDTFDGEKY